MTVNSETAKEIINSEAYRALVAELKSHLRISVIESYEDVFARLDAASIVRSELEVDEIKSLFGLRSNELKRYSIKKYTALHDNPDEQEYPVGEEPSTEDKDSNIVSQGYAPGFLLINAIELLLSCKGVDSLNKYLKASRIPKAHSYSKQVIKFSNMN